MAQKNDTIIEKNLNIGIVQQDREAVVSLLTSLLADEYVLYTKTRNYHWNVVSPHFNDYHKFFEGQYTEIAVFIDDVAERIRQLGGKAIATLDELKSHTRLKEHPGQYPTDKMMFSNLAEDHESLIRNLRLDLKKSDESFHDMGTSDFLTGLMENHEKMLWMIRATAPS
ncbi:DNA-binding ferritin-like protein (oxidative damage protectant) [Candidatus Nitrosarchaeum limnium SFB1]|jgi:starvation-inducible DNA-binding protein|uniref:DNA-binding ferritin-like protein (Oxidative damage protectant) n=1 Tax=Candidatus Nitrosarchaeum limnium SFB1 TaxID=886738 RepID=F3KII9_9ARCH|nr:DNA-binding ferritin-like protein (oxidative damage protectant) [Candidatus Nitrosarchaeum limnium SFB1]